MPQQLGHARLAALDLLPCGPGVWGQQGTARVDNILVRQTASAQPCATGGHGTEATWTTRPPGPAVGGCLLGCHGRYTPDAKGTITEMSLSHRSPRPALEKAGDTRAMQGSLARLPSDTGSVTGMTLHLYTLGGLGLRG